MKLSANIQDLFTELPLLERPKAAHKAGFSAIDVNSPFDASPADWEAALNEANSRMLSFDLPAGDFFEGGEGLLADPNQYESFEMAMQRSLEFAERLKVDSINLVSGRALNTAPGKAWRTLVERACILADALESRGMHLTIEPLNTHDYPKVLVYNLETALDFIADVDCSNVALQIDIYEMHNMEPGLTEQLRIKSKWIRRVQLCDFPKRHQPGSENMNLVDIERALVEGGYKGWISAAYEPTDKTENSLEWLNTLSVTALSERLQS
jgi:hydroxypyruvate isomerase